MRPPPSNSSFPASGLLCSSQDMMGPKSGCPGFWMDTSVRKPGLWHFTQEQPAGVSIIICVHRHVCVCVHACVCVHECELCVCLRSPLNQDKCLQHKVWGQRELFGLPCVWLRMPLVLPWGQSWWQLLWVNTKARPTHPSLLSPEGSRTYFGGWACRLEGARAVGAEPSRSLFDHSTLELMCSVHNGAPFFVYSLIYYFNGTFIFWNDEPVCSIKIKRCAKVYDEKCLLSILVSQPFRPLVKGSPGYVFGGLLR